MTVRLSDAEIAELIGERKVLAGTLSSLLRPRLKRGHFESDIPARGVSGNEFVLIIRKSRENALDFSVIVAHQLPESNRLFRLRRYNGNSHEHTNKIEKDMFRDFHIHTATARYQALGGFEDGYAEPTDRYAELDAAVRCMLEDSGLGEVSTVWQPRLFEVM